MKGYGEDYQKVSESDIVLNHSNTNFSANNNSKGHKNKPNVLKNNLKDKSEILKDIRIEKYKRQGDIIKIIRENKGGLTISDIRAKGSPSIKSCGEKTFQRELVAMVSSGVLKKEGEKRWSKYYLAK
jgi:hypothetical protein